MGDQLQKSFMKPQSLHPVWEPPERFQFIYTNRKKSKLVISVYHYTGSVENIPLGDVIIKMADLECKREFQTHNLELVHPETGKKLYGDNGKTLMEVMLKVDRFENAKNEERQLVFEYQRWNPIQEIAWGNDFDRSTGLGHLLITDNGRWCTVDGT